MRAAAQDLLHEHSEDALADWECEVDDDDSDKDGCCLWDPWAILFEVTDDLYRCGYCAWCRENAEDPLPVLLRELPLTATVEERLVFK